MPEADQHRTFLVIDPLTLHVAELGRVRVVRHEDRPQSDNMRCSQ